MCGSVSGGGVCYSGDSVGSVAIYFCDDGYTLQGDSTRECLSTGLWNGLTPLCIGRPNIIMYITTHFFSNCVASSTSSETSCGTTTTVIVGVVCSLVFLSVGVLLGVVCASY